MLGIDYRIDEVVRRIDGDTVPLFFSRTIKLSHSFVDVQQVDRDTWPRGLPIRLVYVDTPERGEAGYREATAMLHDWLTANGPAGLRIVTYEGAGWDRLLGDIYVDGDRNSTASRAMLEAGWPIWRGYDR